MKLRFWQSFWCVQLISIPILLFDQKLWHKTQFLSFPVFSTFVRKITEKSQLTHGHFTTISGHRFANCINNFHKTEVLTVILRGIVCLNLNWIKSNSTILVKTYFFHAWKCIISGLVCWSEFLHLLGIQPSYFQDVCFSKILWGFHDPHNQVKCQ